MSNEYSVEIGGLTVYCDRFENKDTGIYFVGLMKNDKFIGSMDLYKYNLKYEGKEKLLDKEGYCFNFKLEEKENWNMH